jgi:ubiquitin-protein ligase E3 C
MQPPETRSHPTLPAAIALALLPFKAFPAPAPTPAAKSNSTLALSPQRTAALTSFTLSILSIPLLPHRIPLSSLTALAGMPLEAILVHAASPPLETELQTLEPEKAAHLLANVLAFSSKRIAGFSSSKVLNGYLRVLQLLLNRLPSSLFIEKRTEVAEDVKGKGKTTEVMVIEDSDDEDEDDARVIQRAREKVGTTRTAKDADGDITMAPMATVPNPPPSNPRTTFTLDPRTFTFLSSLASREHLTAVLTLSTRYSSTSRPYLASFLVSLLTTWPAKRDEIINTIVYGPSSGSGAGERGGGLLRELFRGYVRAGALGRLLGRAGKDQGGAIMQAVSDPTLGMDWTTLILLSQLYARCLLTLGDDEFYSTRNPLTLDEVVGLSGLLRNLAFSLYWQEGNFGAGESELVVVGTRMGIEALRSLATTLLQQIHARE